MIRFEDLNLTRKSDGLLPVIIQDDTTLAVLMLGYMNREAFEKSVQEKRVTFYSRSKGRMWTKGETSGNFLHIVSLIADCDADTLLIRVNPDGPVCHSNTTTCFTKEENRTAETEGFIRQLQRIIQERHRDMSKNTYTTKLFTEGINKIAQKVGEEAVETVIEAVAGNREAMLREASDLIYHLLVLLEATDCSIADIEQELARRHSEQRS